MQLNITFQGVSVDIDLPLDFAATDADIKRVSLELLRTGGIPGIVDPTAADGVFNDFMIDRLRNADGEERLFLRPKTPFGR